MKRVEHIYAEKQKLIRQLVSLRDEDKTELCDLSKKEQSKNRRIQTRIRLLDQYMEYLKTGVTEEELRDQLKHVNCRIKALENIKIEYYKKYKPEVAAELTEDANKRWCLPKIQKQRKTLHYLLDI